LPPLWHHRNPPQRTGSQLKSICFIHCSSKSSGKPFDPLHKLKNSHQVELPDLTIRGIHEYLPTREGNPLLFSLSEPSSPKDGLFFFPEVGGLPKGAENQTGESAGKKYKKGFSLDPALSYDWE